MTTEAHTERERVTGRRPLRAHARETVDRALLGAATRRVAEAEHRPTGPRTAGYGAPSAGPTHGANSATKTAFCIRDRRMLRLVGMAVADTAGLVPFVEAAR